MPDIEDRVRELLERRAADVDPHVAVPPTLERRAHRRFAVVAAVTAVVVIVAVAGAAAALRAVPGGPVNRPGDSTPTTQIEACAAADLGASATLEGAAGSREGAITVVNRSTVACTLAGTPTPILRDAQSLAPVSTQVTVTQSEPAWRVDKQPEPPGWPVVTLGAGERATVRVGWSNWCGSTPVAWSLALPSGDSFEVRDIGLDAPPCNGPGQPSTIEIGPFEPAS